MQKNIILVSNFYPPETMGGAEIVAHRQAKMLLRNGWSVTVLAGRLPSESKPSGHVDTEEYDGITVYRVSIASLNVESNFRFARAATVLEGLISVCRPKWVHFHNVIGLGADMIPLAKRSGISVAVTLHDNWGFCFKNTRLRNDGSLCADHEECSQCQLAISNGTTEIPIRLRRDFIAHCLNQADVLISPSRDLASAYQRAGFGDDIQFISNGIDLEQVQAKPREQTPVVKFLCSAYLGEHKGLLVLMEALQRLGQDPALSGKWEVSIAGHGHLEAQLRQSIIDNKLEKHARLLGRLSRTELLANLAGSQVVILPSIWPENEPVSLLEGIASGAALIGTKLGGIPDLIEDGATGILCRPADPEALSQAMRRLICEPGLITRFSQNNLARRSSIDERIAMDKIEALYNHQVCRYDKVKNITIVCRGLHLDPATVVAIDLLEKAIPNSPIRLLWSGWIENADWQHASAFWWWSKTGGMNELEMGIKHGLPIFMRAGQESKSLRHILKGLKVYQNSTELLAFFNEISQIKPDAQIRFDSSMFRLYKQLREAHHFYLPVEV